MAITQADIQKIEAKWDVEIERMPDGSYEVISDPTHSFLEGYKR